MSRIAFGDCQEFFMDEDTTKRFAPKNFVVIKYGKVPYSINGEQGSFDFAEDDADNIINEFNCRGKDLVIDYDHGTLDSKNSSAGDAPAAGWICELVKSAEGMVANVKNWTPKGRGHLESGQYRYWSPVLKFDKKTQKPEYMQSVALTNHPATHNLEALVAANDTETLDVGKVLELADEERAEKKELDFSNDFKTIKELKECLDEAKYELVASLNDLEESCPDDEEKVSEIRAFADELFGSEEQDQLALADMDAVIVRKRGEMTGQQMLDWIKQKLEDTIDEGEKEQLEAEQVRLEQFQRNNPALWDKGFAMADKKIMGLLKQEDAEPSRSFSDFASDIGFEDKEEEDVKKEVKALTDVKAELQKFMALHDCTSFNDVTKKIIDMRAEVKVEKAQMKKDLALKDATMAVEIEMNKSDCKIVESEREWATQYFMDCGEEKFNAWLNKLPVAVSSVDTKVFSSKAKEQDPIVPAGISRVAKAMGQSEEEIAEAHKKHHNSN